jgi:osmoprotectant transport system permease protein
VRSFGVGFFYALLLALSAVSPARAAAEVRIGSKSFTESIILAEIAAGASATSGDVVVRRLGLGGTRLLWNALRSGEIDVYPEYTGTLKQEILKQERLEDDAALDRALAVHGLRKSRSLGFDNRYALGMTREKAERLQIATISDLARHPALTYGFSEEFVERADGWPGLRAAYGLTAAHVRGLDHDIAYKGLIEGSIDVIDLYATDADLADARIRILDDDRHYFSDNEAVLLYRADLEQRAPRALAAMLRLEGRIDAPAMIGMNVAVKIGRRTESEAASSFLSARLGIAPFPVAGIAQRILLRTIEHLSLTAVSLAAAIAVALPLGVLAAKQPAIGHGVLASVGILQTIPSLALLVFMIPMLGIGAPPAIAALFLYSLLPIVSNVASGLASIPAAVRNSAIALGLTPMRRLLLVELPMASPAIFAGLKTAAVINVGTATLGALIGAGGLGQPIFTGIRLDNFGLILEGAVPAALLALAVQGLFALAERRFVPHGLRLRPSRNL